MGRRTASPAEPDALADAAPLRRRLLAWYRRSRRDLPWRRTRDPYAIWVAETMLQQTRSEAVEPYYARFLRRFPTPAALARAREARVLAAWAGLGYYARARNLHRAAREIVARHGGRVPEDLQALAALPGVGRYTLGAVASIAFDRALPLVDGNVARVFARWLAIDRPVSGSDAELWRVAEVLLPRRRPGDWNQALMDLGAVVCLPRNPRCDTCPVRPWCRAAREGRAHELPRPRARPPSRSVLRALAVVEHDERLLLLRREEGRLLHGMWELPTVDLSTHDDAAEKLHAALRDTGLRAARLEEVATIRHAILDCRITARVFRTRIRTVSTNAGRWHPIATLHRLPLSAATTRALAAAGIVTTPQFSPRGKRHSRPPSGGGVFPAAE